jgi:hypothetical protein
VTRAGCNYLPVWTTVARFTDGVMRLILGRHSAVYLVALQMQKITSVERPLSGGLYRE